MAHKKAGGSTSLGRDSVAKRLGVRFYIRKYAKSGSILVRQRGTKIHPGKNVMKGGDDTLFAKAAGIVKFTRKKMKKFDGKLKPTRFVHVVPESKK